MTAAEAFREGATDSVPVLLALMPFGLVTGVAAVEAGLPLALAIGMSYIVFAGSAQLAALQLIALGSPAVVILATTVLINLRFLLYSASLGPHLRSAPWPLRALLAALMTDHTMALASQRYGVHPQRARKVAYATGVALPIWAAWTTSSTVGVFVGAALPAAWSLEFAVPLVFLTMWVGAMARGKRSVLAAGLASALVAVLARPLPLNMGLLVAAFAGIAVGLAWEARFAGTSRPGPRGHPEASET